MNRFKKFFALVKYTNNQRKFVILIFLSFISNFTEMFGLVMVIPLTLTLLDGNNTGIGVEYLDKIIVQLINNGLNMDPLLLIIIIITLVFVAKLLLLSYVTYQQFTLVQNIGEKIANNTFLNELNEEYLDQYNEGSSEKIRRTLYDTLKVSSSISGLIMIISEVFLFLLVIGLFLTINTKLFYSVFIIFLIALGYASVSKKFIFNSSKRQQRKYSDWLKFLQQSFGGIKMIKLNNSEIFFSKMHSKQTKEYFSEEKKLNFIYIIPKIFFEFLLLISFIILIVSTKFVMDLPNHVIIPLLALFTLTAIRLVPSIYKIIISFQNLVQAEPHLADIYKVLIEDRNYTSKDQSSLNEISFAKKLSLENISFKYDQDYIFKQLNFEIHKNNIIGIFGPSGSGKTTLIDLISGLINANDGTVLVDKKNIHENLNNWQKKIGYVYQDTFIIDDNLKNNIFFSKQDLVDDDYFYKITKLLKIDNLIVDRNAGEMGAKLSGGQKQRIGIARALVYKPELLILDEFTSSLDIKSEEEILSIVKDINENIKTTIIMISHRKNPFKICNKIYQINNFSLEEISK
jgi:ATP-binding cassette, subfamily B, bacterial PglK